MKKRYIIAILLVLLLVGVWLQQRNAGPQQDPGSARIQIATLSNTPSLKQFINSAIKNVQNTGQPPPQTEEMSPAEQERHQRSLDEWRAPIEFYGKVVDEKEQPVPEVSIDFKVNDLSKEGHSVYQTQSDANGLFSIVGIHGKLLHVKVNKEGYYTSTRDNLYFMYAGAQSTNFVPNSTAPIIFHLQKKKTAESLIAINYPGFAKISQLHRNGDPFDLDLARGGKAGSTQDNLRLEFWGDEVKRDTKKFNWKCRLSVVGGKIMETKEEFNLIAPENGYQSVWEIEMPASAVNWKTDFDGKFFFLLPEGNYGRMDFHLLARNGVFTVQSFINPSGSRNLEFDPALQIQPQ